MDWKGISLYSYVLFQSWGHKKTLMMRTRTKLSLRLSFAYTLSETLTDGTDKQKMDINLFSWISPSLDGHRITEKRLLNERTYKRGKVNERRQRMTVTTTMIMTRGSFKRERLSFCLFSSSTWTMKPVFDFDVKWMTSFDDVSLCLSSKRDLMFILTKSLLSQENF